MKRAPIALLLATASAPLFAGATTVDCSATNPLGNDVCCVTSGITGTEICINNVDDPGQGFNSTAAAVLPATGNSGTNVGEQRLEAFIKAAQIWADTLTSTETIWVQSTFQDRGFTPCLATSGVLGAAGSIQILANFEGESWPNSWYQSALANKLAADDIIPGSPDASFLAPAGADDIIAFFNPNLGRADDPGTPLVNEACLTASKWYYGFDNNELGSDTDLLSVLLHEMGHGLGFANTVDENGSPNNCTTTGNCINNPGSAALGYSDVYSAFSRDTATGKHWNNMTDAQRVASATNGQLVWDGPTVTADAPSVLGGPVFVEENSPNSAVFPANPATFGSPIGPPPGFTGDVVFVDDGSTAGAGGTIRDGCQTPFTNAGAVAGNIVLVDRGLCTFTVKAQNAQANGAVGLIVANNAASGFPSMAGNDPALTLVAVGITQADGNALKADLAGPPNVSIYFDASLGLQGADEDGFVKLYSPFPLAAGSSVSHWDITAFPNLLMEPAINPDLQSATTLDLTPSQLTDIGWDGSIHCPVGSDDSETVDVAGCDSGVDNDFGPFVLKGTPMGKSLKTRGGTVYGGCYIADLIRECSFAVASHGDYVNCVAAATSGLRKGGAITSAESDAILDCAQAADVP